MDMIERVARALYEQDHASEQWDENYAKYFAWDGPNFKGQDYFRRVARAAIEAMREPTDEMVDACDINIPTEGMIIGVWTDMIDAALGKVDA